MKTVLRLSIIILLFSCNKKEDPQEQVTNDCTGEYTTAGILVEIDEEIQDTLGTWTTAALEKKSNLKTLNLPLDKKVYFAGEIYDPYQQMGVPGAILSGYYSADKLITE